METFLRPNEVIVWTGLVNILTQKDKMPQTVDDILEGMEALWMRIVWHLEKTPEALEYWEKEMNSSLKDAGAWEQISLKDLSYLNLLNPAVVSGPGWGIAPDHFHCRLETQEIRPEINLTPDDPEANDPDYLYQMGDNLLAPLRLPREYR